MWKKFKSKELVWLYQITDKRKRYVGVLIFIQALLSVSGVAYALLLRGAIDEASKGNQRGFFLYLGAIIGMVLLQIALRAVNRYMEEYLRTAMENAFKDRLFDQILKKDFASVTHTHSGEWMNRLTSDTVVCANGITEILPQLIGMLVKLLAVLAMILILQPMFAWALIPGGLVMLLLTYLFRKLLKRLHKEVQEKDGSLRVLLQEHISSLLIIRSFVTEEKSREQAKEAMRAHQKARMKKANFSNVCNIGFAMAMNGIYLLGGVGYCGYGILTGTLSYGTFVAMLQLISQIQSPFANLSGFMPKFYGMLASAERLMEAENYEDDCQEGVRALKEVQSFYKNQFEKITLEKVSFSYAPLGTGEETQRVIQNLSLEIKKGDYVAFTGYSGCGKSTVLKLLMSLYPLDEGGCYLLGKEKKEELNAGWRRLFAYVPQGNQLMCGSIRDLITFSGGEKEGMEERIWQALRISCADEFVRELEAGIDTVLGEKGLGLSEGQMQRLAIARAVYSDSPILLLDEATSALDEGTECQVLENLQTMTDKTVLIVTHRMRALEICSKEAHFTEEGVTIKDL